MGLMRPKLIAICVLSSVMTVVACGDDDDSGANVSTGLPANQELSSLDAAETLSACEDVSDAYRAAVSEDELERVACTLAAVMVSITVGSDGEPEGDSETCEEQTQRCIDGRDYEGEKPDIDLGPSEADCAQATVDDALRDCGATVAEYERCINAHIAAVKTSLGRMTCDALEDFDEFQSMLESDIDANQLEGCEALREKCPGVGPLDQDREAGIGIED
jgi:hypothetical protein